MGNQGMTRRQVLRAGVAAIAVPEVLGAASAGEDGELRFRLTETAGLRRFGYPVSIVLPRIAEEAHFRLNRGGQVVPAQFRRILDPRGQSEIVLDFPASPEPLESQSYSIAFGDGVTPGPEPTRGLRVEQAEGIFRVLHGPDLRFDVPEDLAGFLNGVGNDGLPYVRANSEGLRILSSDLRPERVGGKGPDGVSPKATITRQGPMAVGLRFEGTTPLGGDRRVPWTVSMAFPQSKSWVETTWSIDDPEGDVAGLEVDLRLAVDGDPTLVDLGAGSMVYGQIKGQERMTLRARASGLAGKDVPWEVLKGSPDRFASFAVPPQGQRGQAEGWAHVMDRTRCVALAVAAFGQAALDEIEIGADGRLRLVRRFADRGAVPLRGPKTWTFWFHFVGMPVQVGAATSPQAMLAPLELSWQSAGP
jgi:hypothetical protein